LSVEGADPIPTSQTEKVMLFVTLSSQDYQTSISYYVNLCSNHQPMSSPLRKDISVLLWFGFSESQGSIRYTFVTHFL